MSPSKWETLPSPSPPIHPHLPSTLTSHPPSPPTHLPSTPTSHPSSPPIHHHLPSIPTSITTLIIFTTFLTILSSHPSLSPKPPSPPSLLAVWANCAVCKVQLKVFRSNDAFKNHSKAVDGLVTCHCFPGNSTILRHSCYAKTAVYLNL